MRTATIKTAFGLLLALAAGCGRAPGDDAAQRPADGNTAASPAAVTAAAPALRVPIDDAPVKGSRSALVTLVAFSDYECPFCAHANATVEQLQKAYGDKLRVVARHNPLPFHTHAEP